MRRGLLLVVSVMLLAVTPAFVSAQFGGIPGIPGLGGFFSSGSSCGDASPALKVRPYVGMGYYSIGVNFNLPVGTGDRNTPYGLDLKLGDGGVWMGSVGLDASMSNFSLFLRADGSAEKNVRIFTGADAWYFAQDTYWEGSKLQWWDVDGAIGYGFTDKWSLLLGLRYDKLTVNMRNPVSANGPWNGPDEFFRQDFLVKTWIPYVGVRLAQPYYRAQALYSPFASPDISTPRNEIDGDNNYGSKWNFQRSGSFFEAYGEYDMASLNPFVVSVWAKGSWMRIEGDGDMEWKSDLLPAVSSSGSAYFGRNDLGVGLKLSLTY